MLRSPQDVYARHLLSPRGYPLWTPDPSTELLAVRQEGLRIGDVGVVVPEDGSFDIFFNLCLPHDHPFHQTAGVPDGFRHIELNGADIVTVPDAEAPGRMISTSSVTQVRNLDSSDEFSSSPRTSGYEFSLSSSEGAVLILPAGAERHDLRDPRPFRDEAVRNGPEWYRFAKERLGRIISYDSIYVVTGLHKARTWSLATYENTSGNGEVPVQLQMIRRGSGNVPAAYNWRTSRAVEWRVGPDSSHEIPNQAVFIRGFKIAVRTGRSGPRGRSIGARLSGIFPDFWLGDSRRGSQSIGFSQAGTHATVYPSRNHTVGVEIQRFPAVSQPFHPSDTINQYLLHKEPAATIAVAHDNDWITLLENGLLKPEELLQAGRLTSAVAKNYRSVFMDGSVCLESENVSGRVSGLAMVERSEHATSETELELMRVTQSLTHAKAVKATALQPEEAATSVNGQALVLTRRPGFVKDSSNALPSLELHQREGNSNIHRAHNTEQLPSHVPSPLLIEDGDHGLNTMNAEIPNQSNDHNGQASHLSSIWGTKQKTCEPRSIIFFGETGSGKSSTINLLIGAGASPADSPPLTTQASTCYETILNGLSYKLWDTRSLRQSSLLRRILVGDSGSVRELKEFLGERYRHHEIDLLVYCVRGSRATKALQKCYNTFCTTTRRLAAPVAVIVTFLEDEPEMEGWWKRNSARLEELGMKFDGHACITALPGHPRAAQSKQQLIRLITRTYDWEAKQDGLYFGSPAQRSFSVSSSDRHSEPPARKRTISQMLPEYSGPLMSNALESSTSAAAKDYHAPSESLTDAQLPSPVLGPSNPHRWLVRHFSSNDRRHGKTPT